MTHGRHLEEDGRGRGGGQGHGRGNPEPAIVSHLESLGFMVQGSITAAHTIIWGEISWFDIRGEMQRCDWPKIIHSLKLHTGRIQKNVFRPVTGLYCPLYLKPRIFAKRQCQRQWGTPPRFMVQGLGFSYVLFRAQDVGNRVYGLEFGLWLRV